MIAEYFLDTNVLVYLVDKTPAYKTKRHKALSLIESADFGLSIQVMQEFFVTVTRKIEKPLSSKDAHTYLEKLSTFPLVNLDYGIVTEAIRNAALYQLSYWDGAIIAAAERIQAHTIYSEDLNRGQRYGTVKVINPFL